MPILLGVVMDPITTIDTTKDSTFAILQEANRRGWQLFYLPQSSLFLRDGITFANALELAITPDGKGLSTKEPITLELSTLDVILMRKDPPFDIEYIITTYLLEKAEQEGVLVVNKPQGLRDANEKCFISWFPQCCPPALITRDMQELQNFVAEQQQVVLKSLVAMGGSAVFYVHHNDLNRNILVETLTQKGTCFVMAQRFIPEIRAGDKRIILIDGKPLPYALARIPNADDFRGNMAAGGKPQGVELTARDHWICEQIAPSLRQKGLWLVGIDVIGDYLTEINVTSPTGIRQLDTLFGLNSSAKFCDFIATRLKLSA